jgi:hypothetical protein
MSSPVSSRPGPILTARQERIIREGFDAAKFGGVYLASEEHIRTGRHNESIGKGAMKESAEKKVIQRACAAKNDKADIVRP